MPVLPNPRHERFAQELASGKSASEAYRLAGYSPNEGNAIRLKGNEKVQARLTELQERIAVRVGLSREWVLDRLKENADRAMQVEAVRRDGQETGEYRYEGSVANRALELIGKELGMFIDRKEVGGPGDFKDMADEELRREFLKEAAELVPTRDGETTH